MTDDAYGWETHAVVWSIEVGNTIRREFGPPWKVAWFHPSRPCECWISGGHVGWVKYDPSGLVAETIWYDRNRPFIARLRDHLRVWF
jgi:hypothetical protein